MCFSPQRRTIFRHLNFKKWSRTVGFLTFSLPNVFFATAAYNFSTSELQKVVPDRQFFNIFTSECAFRHSGVQFLISPVSSDLRTRRFNRPTFGLTWHTNHWKNAAFRDFSNIWRGCIFFLLTFALLHLLSADLTTLLCFSTVHIVGSFYLNFLRWIVMKISRKTYHYVIVLYICICMICNTSTWYRTASICTYDIWYTTCDAWCLSMRYAIWKCMMNVHIPLSRHPPSMGDRWIWKAACRAVQMP